MCFMIKEEKGFDKYMKIWEKQYNKNIISELIYSKKYVIAKKTFIQMILMILMKKIPTRKI